MIKAIHHDSRILRPDSISSVEVAYKARYVGSFALSGHMFKDVFYVTYPVRSKGHGHYFGIMLRPGTGAVITGVNNILPGEDSEGNVNYVSLCGFVCDDVFYYSGGRHDLVCAPDGRWIDGGLEYTRSNTEVTHFIVLTDAGPQLATRNSSEPIDLEVIEHIHRGYA